jgi:hypothetical protein
MLLNEPFFATYPRFPGVGSPTSVCWVAKTDADLGVVLNLGKLLRGIVGNEYQGEVGRLESFHG